MPYCNLLILAFGALLMLYLVNLFVNIIRGKAPFITTNKKAIQKIIAEIDFVPQKALELGCGQAKFLRMLEKKYPNTELLGIENDWWPILIAKIKNKLFKSKVKVLKEDLFVFNSKKFDLIYLFLNIRSMKKLQKMLKKNFCAKQTIISYVFKIPGLEARKKIKVGPYGEYVYIYQLL